MELGRSNLTVAMNKTSTPGKNVFLRGGWEDSALNSNLSKLLELSETSVARKLILRLQVNIDKANNCRYDVTR